MSRRMNARGVRERWREAIGAVRCIGGRAGQKNRERKRKTTDKKREQQQESDLESEVRET